MIIPAIDIMNGKSVQLKQGNVKILEEPISKRSRIFSYFPEVNVIDLDGAFSKGDNKELIKKLCREFRCNVGGGIRSTEIAREYLRNGARHVIIGTRADRDFLKQLPSHRVIVALDIKEGKLATEGWRKLKKVDLKNKIKELEENCSAFLITNIDIEGCNEGCNMEFIKSLQGLTKNRIIVAGGISSYEEICQINELGFDQVLGMALYTGKIDLYEALIKVLKLTPLIPTIVYDKQVMMLAYSNRDSILNSLRTGKATYYSRKRGLWRKGESSGNVQKLLRIDYDCDCDTLLYTVSQKGNACHRNKYTCFGEKEFSFPYLLDFLKERIKSDFSSSLTSRLAGDKEKLNKKIIEEANEVTRAVKKDHMIGEISDLMYFITVFMATNKITFKDIKNELSVRHNI